MPVINTRALHRMILKAGKPVWDAFDDFRKDSRNYEPSSIRPEEQSIRKGTSGDPALFKDITKTPVRKIISGGQTGVDEGGLAAGEKLGLQVGGTAPKGYRRNNIENAVFSDDKLKTILKESDSSNYNVRTKQNVLDADATVIFGNTESAGTKNTIKFLKQAKKKYIINPTEPELTRFLNTNKVQTLNVAGNRGTKEGMKVARDAQETLIGAIGTKKVPEESKFYEVPIAKEFSEIGKAGVAQRKYAKDEIRPSDYVDPDSAGASISLLQRRSDELGDLGDQLIGDVGIKGKYVGDLSKLGALGKEDGKFKKRTRGIFQPVGGEDYNLQAFNNFVYQKLMKATKQANANAKKLQRKGVFSKDTTESILKNNKKLINFFKPFADRKKTERHEIYGLQDKSKNDPTNWNETVGASNIMPRMQLSQYFLSKDFDDILKGKTKFQDDLFQFYDVDPGSSLGPKKKLTEFEQYQNLIDEQRGIQRADKTKQVQESKRALENVLGSLLNISKMEERKKYKKFPVPQITKEGKPRGVKLEDIAVGKYRQIFKDPQTAETMKSLKQQIMKNQETTPTKQNYLDLVVQKLAMLEGKKRTDDETAKLYTMLQEKLDPVGRTREGYPRTEQELMYAPPIIEGETGKVKTPGRLYRERTPDVLKEMQEDPTGKQLKDDLILDPDFLVDDANELAEQSFKKEMFDESPETATALFSDTPGGVQEFKPDVEVGKLLQLINTPQLFNRLSAKEQKELLSIKAVYDDAMEVARQRQEKTPKGISEDALEKERKQFASQYVASYLMPEAPTGYKKPEEVFEQTQALRRAIEKETDPIVKERLIQELQASQIVPTESFGRPPAQQPYIPGFEPVGTGERGQPTASFTLGNVPALEDLRVFYGRPAAKDLTPEQNQKLIERIVKSYEEKAEGPKKKETKKEATERKKKAKERYKFLEKKYKEQYEKVLKNRSPENIDALFKIEKEMQELMAEQYNTGGLVKVKKKKKFIPKILKNKIIKKKNTQRPLGVGAALRGYGAVNHG